MGRKKKIEIENKKHRERIESVTPSECVYASFDEPDDELQADSVEGTVFIEGTSVRVDGYRDNEMKIQFTDFYFYVDKTLIHVRKSDYYPSSTRALNNIVRRVLKRTRIALGYGSDYVSRAATEKLKGLIDDIAEKKRKKRPWWKRFFD